jgi:hypothetical protein
MSEINIREITSQEQVKDKNITDIVFSEPNREMNGFDASRITKNSEGFEMDSAYVLKDDVPHLLKSIKMAQHLGWFN